MNSARRLVGPRNRLLWTLGILAFLALAFGYIAFKGRGSDEELRKQLELARSEGLYTTEEQFAASIPTSSPAENAAPYYRKLPEGGENPSTAIKSLIYRPSQANLAAAQAILHKNRTILETLDAAVQRPKCWFDRDWSMGSALLLPEYARMKHGAKLLCLRGSVAAHEGRHEDALADLRKVFQVSRHAGQERHSVAKLIEISIHRIGMVTLAGWAYQNPKQPAYRAELRQIVDIPEYDLRSFYERSLLDILSLIELSSTPDGREKLGLEKEDVSSLEKFAPMLINRRRAKVAVVAAVRKKWATLDAPPSKMQNQWDQANAALATALLAFPTAGSLYFSLGDEMSPIEQERTLTSERQKYIALARALSQYPIPKTLPTSDLLSPYDQKPLIYSYRNGVITFQVSGHESSDDGHPLRLQIPPK